MISAIVCVDENWGIGSNGNLLIHIPEDMKFFKDSTFGATVVMGRKTYESLPKKPLSNRLNIVISSKVKDRYEIQKDGSILVSMEFAKNWIINRKLVEDYIFIIGGGQIYKELLPYCEYVYATKVYHTYENVDTYFPNIENIPEWEIEYKSEIKEHSGVKYQFYTYRKKV